VLSLAQLQEIPVIPFNTSFLQQVFAARSNQQKYSEEMARMVAGNSSPHVTYLYGILYFQALLWIPLDGNLLNYILESKYDSKIAGHMGQDKTIELISPNVFWVMLEEKINNYVRRCLECQTMKRSRHARYGLLHLLELTYGPEQFISMVLIVEFPISNGSSSIWVIIDRFPKKAQCIPLNDEMTDNKCGINQSTT
jgi:hypothetical protein